MREFIVKVDRSFCFFCPDIGFEIPDKFVVGYALVSFFVLHKKLL